MKKRMLALSAPSPFMFVLMMGVVNFMSVDP
jgi:hypothetical protein